jgi:hypothetical protein
MYNINFKIRVAKQMYDFKIIVQQINVNKFNRNINNKQITLGKSLQ